MANPSAGGETELLRVSVSPDWSLAVSVGFWPLIIIIGILIAVFIFCLYINGSIFGGKYEIDSAEIGAGDSKLTFKPNISDKAVAYKIWVELSTRKIGLEIDLDNDVIDEIYESWYAFFTITRDLIKEVPVSKVRNQSTKVIISLSINVLNIGLRPHLTQWQARFRRWYQRQISLDPAAELHPQDIQKKFPEYDTLVADMKAVNEKLIIYREKMYGLVYS